MIYKAQIFDSLQYIFWLQGCNDHQLHSVLTFEKRPDPEIMKQAVRLLIKAVPILSRKYCFREGSLYWEDMKPAQWGEYFKVTRKEEEFDRFFFEQIPEGQGPQIKVCLLTKEPCRMTVLLNHMITDGAGFKNCLYLLSQIYSNLLQNPDYKPETADGDRSCKAVLTLVPPLTKLKTFLLDGGDNNQKSDFRFPMSKEGKGTPFIQLWDIPPESFARLKAYGKAAGVTVNDVLLAAFFRSLSRMGVWNGKPPWLSIMIDMRKYGKDEKYRKDRKDEKSSREKAFTNLTSTVNVQLKDGLGERFPETLEKVNQEMKKKKSGHMGLNPLLKLDLLFRLAGEKRGFALLKDHFNNPHIGMTNIGILDSSSLHFEGSPVTHAFICGSIKYQPYFQLAVSTFQDTVTLSVNLYGNAWDREKVAEFFKGMKEELKAVL